MFEKMKSIFGASGKESIKKTESGAVNQELGSMMAEGKMNIATESEVARMEALDIIQNDSRIKKVYDFYEGKPEMQEKYIQAVIKYGENVGAYRKETGEFEKASWSSVPEMSSSGAKLTKQAEAFNTNQEKISAAPRFFEKLPDTEGKWSKFLGNMSPEEKEEFFAKFANDPKSVIKSAEWDSTKKEFISKASYEIKP